MVMMHSRGTALTVSKRSGHTSVSVSLKMHELISIARLSVSISLSSTATTLVEKDI